MQEIHDIVEKNANVYFEPTGDIIIRDVYASADGRMFIICATIRYAVKHSKSSLSDYRTY